MDTADTSDVTLDRSQTLNLSLNMSSLGKKNGQTLGTVLPVGLCPTQPSTVSVISSFDFIQKSAIQAAGDEARNYQTNQAHVQFLLETRDQRCVEYDQARDDWTNFRAKASKWTEYSNRIHKSEAEKALISEVSYLN